MARVGKDKQPRKHTGRPRKEAIVDELTQKLEASKGVVFTDYKGLTAKQTEDIKAQLREADASFAVTKNSLLKLSLQKSHFADVAKEIDLNNPTATLFMAGDTIIPLKAIAKAFKDFNLPKIKFGIIEGQALDEAGVLKLASLPPREVLLGQLVGMLNSPIQGFVLALNGTLQKLVIVLDQVAKTKPADAAPAPAAQPAQPATEPEKEPQAEAAQAAEPNQPANEPAQDAVEEPGEEQPTPEEKPQEPSKQEENQNVTEGGDSNG